MRRVVTLVVLLFSLSLMAADRDSKPCKFCACNRKYNVCNTACKAGVNPNSCTHFPGCKH